MLCRLIGAVPVPGGEAVQNPLCRRIQGGYIAAVGLLDLLVAVQQVPGFLHGFQRLSGPRKSIGNEQFSPVGSADGGFAAVALQRLFQPGLIERMRPHKIVEPQQGIGHPAVAALLREQLHQREKTPLPGGIFLLKDLSGGFGAPDLQLLFIGNAEAALNIQQLEVLLHDALAEGVHRADVRLFQQNELPGHRTVLGVFPLHGPEFDRDALPHLLRGCPGKGDDEHPVGVHRVHRVKDALHHPFGEHRCLAAARSRRHQNARVPGCDRRQLFLGPGHICHASCPPSSCS